MSEYRDDLSRPSCVSGGAFVDANEEWRAVPGSTQADGTPIYWYVDLYRDGKYVHPVASTWPQADHERDAKLLAAAPDLLSALCTARDLLAHHAPSVPSADRHDGDGGCGAEAGGGVMAEHEPCIGASDDWYTPREIFDALGCTFDLDPCSPGPGHWVPAHAIYTKEDDGLAQPWHGFVWMNPPFGGRFGHVPWLRKFLTHGNGIALVRAYTSSSWFHDWAIHAHAMLFPRGKTKFIRPDGSIGKAPGHGVVLLGMGAKALHHMRASALGLFVQLQGV